MTDELDQTTVNLQVLRSESPYKFSTGSLKAANRVVTLRGREAISKPYRFDVEFTVAGADAPAVADILGDAATLEIKLRDSLRSIFGVVIRVEHLGAIQQDRQTFRARIAPRLWLLRKRTTSRIFQDRTVPEIVAAVLDGAAVAHRAGLVETYKKRTYCVQYQETDLAFVARLLAEEGIFYFFEHAGSHETVVLCDNPQGYAPIAGDPDLVFRAVREGLVPEERHVGPFTRARGAAPGKSLHGDYDFRRPRHELRSTASPPSVGFEGALQAYDHHVRDEVPNVDEASARLRLEQHRTRAVVAHGASGCRRLLPGFRFDLSEHEMGALDGSYVVASVEHEGRAPHGFDRHERVYANTFTCVPADVPLRPKPPKRRVQQVTETARVVGPKGQEIYTDDLGRVKVQFPWDLDGKDNEHSSCWVRVAQAWAGASWGTQFIPRVGMEVVVTFVGGDVDRPLITGCVPNALNMPPFNLPKNSARSGFRTRTVRGGGFNELSFDDAPGQEQVHLRAQGRLDEVVLKDHSITVGGAEHSRVGGGRTEILGGNVRATVAGSRVEQIAGDFKIQVGGVFDRTVGRDDRASVLGDVSIEVAGAHTMIVHGSQHTLVGQGSKKAHSLLSVNGDYNIGAADSLNLKAKGSLTLSVGDSSIELTKDGIKLKAKTVTIEGADGASMKVARHMLSMDKKLTLASDTVELHSSKGIVVMDEEVHIDGKKVNLNCKPREPDKDAEKAALPEDGIVTFMLKHKADDAPMAGVTVMVGTPTGEVIEAHADENGKVSIKGKKGERYMVVGVRTGSHVFGHEQS